MSKLLPPHGGGALKPLLLEGQAAEAECARAAKMKRVPLTSRETGDLIMMGIGAFTPLRGFMGQADWKGACDDHDPAHQGRPLLAHPHHALRGEGARRLHHDRRGGGALGHRDRHPRWATMKVDREVRHRQGPRVQAGLPDHRPEAPGRQEGHGAGRGQPRRARSRCSPSPTSPRCSRASTSAPPRRARCSRSAAGARSPRCSSATRCTAPTPTWPGSPSRSATASTSTSSWASSSPATSRPRCASRPSTPS